MFDFIQAIPGPTFLGYFAIASFVVAIFTRMIVNNDGTLDMPSPPLNAYKPSELASLAGGRSRVIETAVYALVSREMASIEGDEEEMTIEALPSRSLPADEVEKEVYRYLKTPRHPRDLFDESGELATTIDDLLSPGHEKMERYGLRKTEEKLNQDIGVTAAAILIVATAGGTKLIFGLQNDKPVMFLVVLLFVATIAIFLTARPDRQTTRLGRKYLSHLGKTFEWQKDLIAKNKNPRGYDYLPAIALFGGAALGTTQLANFFTIGQRPPPGSSSGGCSGCGSSGCGGGCGGCGGCG